MDYAKILDKENYLAYVISICLSADLPQEVTFFFYIFVLKLVTLCEIFLDEFGQIGS